MKVDLGDLEFEANFKIKRFKAPEFIWHFQAPSKRRLHEVPVIPFINYERLHGIMDLKADNGVDFTLSATDEAGNPVALDPAEYAFDFSVDDANILQLTDNGNGSGRVDAVGTLGVATLSGSITRNSDGFVWTGAEAFNVVTGDAQTFGFSFSEPTETTPDEAAPTV